jgi:hypothetical protein
MDLEGATQGFSLIASIAFWCGIAAFSLAGIMTVLALFGFVHARRVDENDELLVHQPRPVTVVTH